MPVAIHVYIRDKNAAPEDGISVEHVFYGATEAEAEAKREAHLAGCENYGAAERNDRTIEIVEDISEEEMPTWETVEGDIEEEGDDEPEAEEELETES